MMFVANLTWNDLPEFISHTELTSIAPLLLLLCFFSLLLLLLRHFVKHPSGRVFLLDFACYKPPVTQMCSKELAVERTRLYANVSGETVAFMKKMIERTGLGDSTYVAEGLLEDPPNLGIAGARREAEMVVFGAIDQLLAKTKLECKAIGIVVVNCTIFNVVPSLSSLIVNRYKLRDSVASYNITGMGCSAGLRAIGLAQQLLQVHRNSYALVVSTENITQNCYLGNDHSKFLINCLFRVGGAAILLSNRSSDRKSSKYQLIHTVHTHTASFNPSYSCIFQDEDQEGKVGVSITKDLLVAAIKAIESNVTTLAPVVLPISEQIRFSANYILRCLHVSNIQPYIPNFTKAIDHFLPHVGGKPVLDELQRNLGLSEAVMEASRMTLYRFGNTSSSSVWYELAYAEAKGRIKKGDRVWQIAFGSGFKCSSVVWRAIRTVDREKMNPWSDEIDEFPVDLRNVKAISSNYFKPSKQQGKQITLRNTSD